MRIAYSIALFLILSLSACKKKCDPSTAEGAAQCECRISKEFLEALKDLNDTKRIERISEEFDYLEEEKERHIMKGDYTERDVGIEIEKFEGECAFLGDENQAL